MSKTNKEFQPLYLRLKERLEKEIRSGRLAVNQPLLSEREMCERYHVSQITVRAALRELHKQGMVVRIPGKGTFVSEPVAKLDENRRTVGLILNTRVSETMRPFMLEVQTGIKMVMHQAQINFMIFMESESDYLEMARDGRLQGAIIPNPSIGLDILQELQDAKTQLVIIGHPKSRRIVSVDSDNTKAGYILAKHLLDKGYRKIGFIGNNPDDVYCAERLLGYKKALREADIQVKHSWVQFCNSSECGKLQVVQLYDSGADAALCADDFIAGNALMSLREIGVNVPEAFGLTGCNNSILTRFLDPGLTSLELFPELLGKMAAEKLLALMNGETVQSRTLVPSELQVRNSSNRSK